MTKEDCIKTKGVVVEVLPNATFRVKLDEFDRIIIAYISGKMKQFSIKVLLGDKVDLELSPYDLHKGRISHRYK